jgi:pterin-4a-carbinolamine dehydratase
MSEMKKYFAIISIFLIGSILSFITFQKSVNNPNQIKIQSHSLKTKAMSFKEFKSAVSISAIGDVLIHHPVYEDAKIKDGVYDFKPIIKNVKNLLSDADFTMANQESMIGGTELGLSSYPSFNSPFEVADALHDAGVDLVSIANNHTLD